MAGPVAPGSPQEAGAELRGPPPAGSFEGSGPDFAKSPGREDAALDAGLLAAHAAGDLAALVRLYAAAADLCEGRGEADRACFYLTQAYVFALDRGDPAAPVLHARLRAQGREQ